MTVKISVIEDKVFATSPYNPDLPAQARELGGRWNGGEWVFDARDEQQVKELYQKVYGTDGTETSESVTAKVTVLRTNYESKAGLFLAGREIARAFGRDGGAKLGTGVIVIEGDGFDSGGSRANWHTVANEGTVFKLRDVPLLAIEREIKNQDDYDSPYYSFEIIDENNAVDRESLLAERERLVNRIAEIDNILDANPEPVLTFQHQISNGAWVDIDDERRDEFLERCLEYNELNNYDEVIAAMSKGNELRIGSEWYSLCRLFDKIADEEKMANIRAQEAEARKKSLTCKNCGQTGQTGGYPFSTLPSSGFCDDCV